MPPFAPVHPLPSTCHLSSHIINRPLRNACRRFNTLLLLNGVTICGMRIYFCLTYCLADVYERGDFMKIRDEHLYHGAALNQIAEHRLFTAINELKIADKRSRSAFKINDDIAIYFKYCTRALGTYKEYKFTFSKTHLRELREISMVGNRLFIALICVRNRQICCISYAYLTGMIDGRRADAGRKEDQYQILVTLRKREAFRVYMNKYGRKKVILGEPIKVPQNRFPNALFE